MLDRDRGRTEGTAQRQRTGVTHEDHRWRRIEPQEAETGADNRAAQDREFAGPLHIMNLEIFRKDGIADQIGDKTIASGSDHIRHDGEPVEPISDVDRIAGADDDEYADRQEDETELDEDIFEKW